MITLRVPALRERPADILPLTIRMLAGATVRNHRPGLRLSPEASSALVRYRWPGNIRELRNVIERAVGTSLSDIVTPDCSPDLLRNDPHARPLLRLQVSMTSSANISSALWRIARRSKAPRTSWALMSRRCGAGANDTNSVQLTMSRRINEPRQPGGFWSAPPKTLKAVISPDFSSLLERTDFPVV